jgi:hypothetical protein
LTVAKRGHAQDPVAGVIIASEREGPADNDVPSSDVKKMAKAFEIAVGRAPTDAEKLSLLKFARAIGGRFHEDDPFWLIIYAQQNWFTLFEAVPKQIYAAGDRSVTEIDSAKDRVVAEITRHGKLVGEEIVMRVAAGLNDQIARTSLGVTKERAALLSRRAFWGAAVGAALLGGFGTLCGYQLARGRLPFWMARDVATNGGPWAKVAGAILGAPAGWVALIFSLPFFGRMIAEGWGQWKTAAKPADRTLAMAHCVGGVLAVLCELLILGKFIAWVVPT